MELLKLKSWSPYLVGAGIGLLCWFAFWTADHPIGITTAFENTAALVLDGNSFASGSVEALKQNREASPQINWEWMLVVGVFLGAFLSSVLGRDREHLNVPVLWQKRFGSSNALRYLGAFIGGVIMMVGARMAQGCTSGHGISGLLQFAVSSLIFVATFTIVGIVFAKTLYGGVAADV